MICFARLYKLLEKKNKSQFFLIKNGVDHTTMQRIRCNGNVETKSLDKICEILGCSLDEIAEYIPNKK